MVVVVVVVVMMMMVMRDDGDARRLRWKQMMMTKYAGSNFWKNPLQVLSGIGGVCAAGVLVVSQLCFGGRWCLGGTLVVCP